jgi:hypothetical protein
MITSSVTITEPTPLNIYMANLHDYLGPYCFISGSFVVEDDNQMLQKFLFSCNPTTISIAKTHAKFQHNTSEPIYECGINIVLTCNGCDPSDKPMPILNLKWYPFLQGKWYVYLKMERYPTFYSKSYVPVFSHAQKFVERHLFKKIKDHCVKKREDCENDSDGCHPETNKINFNSYRVESQAPVNIVESHTRMGDEFFVPLGVSEYFLTHSQKLMFTYESNTVTISPAKDAFSPTNPLLTNALNEEFGEELIGGKRMPYTIRKLPNRRLYTVKGSRTFAKATTLNKAKRQVRLLYALERRNTKGTRRQK